MAQSGADLAARGCRLRACPRRDWGLWRNDSPHASERSRRRGCGTIDGVTITPDMLPDDIDALKAALVAARAECRQMEARASGAEAMVAHLKLLIAKLKRERFGASSERGKLLDQLEMQLEDLEASATEDEVAAEAATAASNGAVVQTFTRKRPVRAPLPAQ